MHCTMIHIVASPDKSHSYLLHQRGIRKPPAIADEPKRQESSVEWILNRALAPVGEILQENQPLVRATIRNKPFDYLIGVGGNGS